MKVLIVTDAWHPQVNGVVTTLTKTRDTLQEMGHEIELITPNGFKTIPCPTYPEIRLALFPGGKVSKAIRAFGPDHLHIATEGPLGLAARAFAQRSNLAFTTAYHTRFPEYVHSRLRVPLAWTYAFLRWFHAPAAAVMAPTNSVVTDLENWNVGHPVLWPRGVDLELFSPQPPPPKEDAIPIYINVGRVAVEKNLEAFLNLDLDGEKWVVGGGPALKQLKAQYSNVRFFGPKKMSDLPELYNKADVFVFPSRTDTFGLVLLEAMACGLPVAAYPVTGPIDVIGNSEGGVLDEDLGRACQRALMIPRTKPRQHAETFSWQNASSIFAEHLVAARQDKAEYNVSDNPYKDNQGVTRAVMAARNSWSGLMFAVREESAFRQELLLACLMIPLAFWMPATDIETILMVGSVILVLIVELLNSSVEAAIDRISFSKHGLSRRAKDYGSAAVMLTIGLCAGIYAYIGMKYFL